jgi:hypothetical protein
VEVNKILMQLFGFANRVMKGLVGTIQPDALRQPKPAVCRVFRDGSTACRCRHPRSEGGGAERGRDKTSQQGNAQELSWRYTGRHG